MDLHPNFVTVEAEQWFRDLLATMQPTKEMTTYIGRDLPRRMGGCLLLMRAVYALEHKLYLGEVLTPEQSAARDCINVALSYQLQREELRYVAHLAATASPEQLRTVTREIIGSFMLRLPEEFTADYLDQFVAEEEDDELPDLVRPMQPRLARRRKGVPLL